MVVLLNHQDGVWELPGGKMQYPCLPRKNLIINPSFRYWQRYNGGATVGGTGWSGYFADHWVGWTGTGCYGTFTRSAVTPSSFEAHPYLVRSPPYMLTWAQNTVPAGTWPYMGQRVENVYNFAGKTFTVSFWACVASGSTLLELWPYQIFGAGNVANASPNHRDLTVTTTWQRFELTFTFASTSGKTLSTGHYVVPYLYVPPETVGFTLYTWGWQMEPGDVATIHEDPHPTTDLRDCQRYYWKTYSPDTAPGTVTHVGAEYYKGYGGAEHWITFPREMQWTPTITAYAPNGTPGWWEAGGGTQNIYVYYTSPRGVTINVGAYSGIYSGHVVAVAENTSF